MNCIHKFLSSSHEDHCPTGIRSQEVQHDEPALCHWAILAWASPHEKFQTISSFKKSSQVTNQPSCLPNVTTPYLCSLLKLINLHNSFLVSNFANFHQTLTKTAKSCKLYALSPMPASTAPSGEIFEISENCISKIFKVCIVYCCWNLIGWCDMLFAIHIYTNITKSTPIS